MLKRSIRKYEMVLLMINGVIGAGIFGLPSKAFRETGSWSLVAFLVCAIAVYFIILCFAEVSSRFDKTGGPYVYALEAFGPLPAFVTGWLLLLSRFLTYAALINLLVTYLTVFNHWFGTDQGRVITITGLTLMFGLINHVGIRNTTSVNNFLAVGKMTALIIFILAGLFFINPDYFPASPPPSFTTFSATVLVLMFSFGGFESVLVNSGEVQNPGKTLPFALLVAPLIIATTYLLIQFVCIETLPDLATSEKPLAEAAEKFMGRGGAIFIAIGALLSIAGTLNAIMLVGSRLPYAFSQEGQFPGVFSFVHPRYHTPTWSLLLFLVVTIIVSLYNTFIDAATISAITRVMIYAIVCIALIRLRRRSTTEAVFRVRYGNVVAVIGFILTIWLLSGSPLNKMRDVIISVAVGIVIYFFVRRKK
ncbi:APC family permease [Pollutibacter soli]|uniref:APC family permease n=1 Tax=Pollutibacter soli TaxID=3034157 RepID=UPI003013C91B